MTVRLLAVAILGFVLMGYVPRWLALSDSAWIIWAVAAAAVFGGPRLLRHLGNAALGRAQTVRRSATDAVRQALNIQISASEGGAPRSATSSRRASEIRAHVSSRRSSDR